MPDWLLYPLAVLGAVTLTGWAVNWLAWLTGYSKPPRAPQEPAQGPEGPA